MSWPLVRKELREHAGVGLLAQAFSAFILLGLSVQADDNGGRFLAFTQAVPFLGMINAIVAANRLFAREYGSRTQLFLEVLPITRARVFATKWLLGAIWLALLTVAAFFYVLRRQRAVEVIAFSDAVHVLHAGGSYMLALWSFAAMAGMLGRHRYTAWLALLLLIVVAVQAGDLRPRDMSIGGLVDSRIAMARGAAPLRAHVHAWSFSAVCVAVAAALALVGSGAMASALARKMTTRERVFLMCVGFCAMAVQFTLQKETPKPRFLLADGEHLDGQRATVSVLRTADVDAQAARALASVLLADADGLTTALALETRPAIFVLPQHSFDRFVIERAVLEKSQGVVLRAAADAPRDMLRAYVLHEVLVDHTLKRALREDRHVLLDGFTLWWVVQEDAAAQERWWLRAASSRVPVTTESLSRWNETTRTLGEHVSSSMAFAVVDELARHLGRARLLGLMRELFRRPPDDVRVLFEASPLALLERTGIDLPQLARRTEQTRRRQATRFADRLAKRPTLRADVRVAHDPTRGTTIESSLSGARSYWVLYATAGPWQEGSEPGRYDVRGPRGTLPISPRRGQWLDARIEVEDAVLDCNVRVLERRLEVP